MPSLSLSGDVSNQAAYAGGDTVRGTATLRCSTPCTTRSVTVLLKGREKVRVSFTESAEAAAAAVANVVAIAAGGIPHSSAKRHRYIERHELLRASHTLLGADLGCVAGADILQLNAGEHHFPFEMTLPDAVPGSISHTAYDYEADVKYTLELRVDAPGCLRDTTLARRLTVLGNHTAAATLAPLLLHNPLVVDGSKSFFGCGGQLTARAQLPRRCLLLGESARLELDVREVEPLGRRERRAVGRAAGRAAGRARGRRHRRGRWLRRRRRRLGRTGSVLHRLRARGRPGRLFR